MAVKFFFVFSRQVMEQHPSVYRRDAEAAQAEAQQFGLTPVLSTQSKPGGTGYKGVWKTKSQVHPFLAAVRKKKGEAGPTLKVLGYFATAERAALAYAKHMAVRLPESSLIAVAPSVSEVEAWWTYRSAKRIAIETMTADAARKLAKEEGAKEVATCKNPSGYKGVLMRKSEANGGPASYAAHWQPSVSVAKRLGKKSLRFGVWSCPEHAALVLARESTRILNESEAAPPAAVDGVSVLAATAEKMAPLADALICDSRSSQVRRPGSHRFSALSVYLHSGLCVAIHHIHVCVRLASTVPLLYLDTTVMLMAQRMPT